MDRHEVLGLVRTRLIESATREITRGLEAPGEMTQQTFLMLQERAETLERAVARGEDCTPGFDLEVDAVERLLDECPWTLHPDHGCVLRSAVEKLDAVAAPE